MVNRTVLTSVVRGVAALTLGLVIGAPTVARGDEPNLPPSAGGSRDPLFCIVAPVLPQRQVSTIWSANPVFFWAGNISRIEVTPNDDRDTVLWSYEPTAGELQVTYSGEPLTPNTVYQWALYNQRGTLIFTAPFQLIETAEHDQIADALTELETELVSENASEDAIALARTSFFAEQELWADALREAAQVTDKSSRSAQYLQAVRAAACPQMIGNSTNNE
ncbi:MAG: hypothetical protein ACTS2F_21355 [Thainema sp.]